MGEEKYNAETLSNAEKRKETKKAKRPAADGAPYNAEEHKTR